jgi:hypothetical protein
MSADTESRAGYVIGAVLNGALLYVVHMLPSWNVKVVTGDWGQVLYPVTLALAVQVLGNLFLAWRTSPFRHRLLHILFDFTSIAALWRIVRVFPFDFDPLGFAAGNTVFRVLLYLALFGVFVGMVSNVVRLLGIISAEKQQEEDDDRAEQEGESGGSDGSGGRSGRSRAELAADDPYAEDSGGSDDPYAQEGPSNRSGEE